MGRPRGRRYRRDPGATGAGVRRDSGAPVPPRRGGDRYMVGTPGAAVPWEPPSCRGALGLREWGGPPVRPGAAGRVGNLLLSSSLPAGAPRGGCCCSGSLSCWSPPLPRSPVMWAGCWGGGSLPPCPGSPGPVFCPEAPHPLGCAANVALLPGRHGVVCPLGLNAAPGPWSPKRRVWGGE